MGIRDAGIDTGCYGPMSAASCAMCCTMVWGMKETPGFTGAFGAAPCACPSQCVNSSTCNSMCVPVPQTMGACPQCLAEEILEGGCQGAVAACRAGDRFGPDGNVTPCANFVDCLANCKP
jgi:hypothetical protein